MTTLPGSGSPDRWRLRDLLVAIVFCGILGMQILVPLTRLGDPKPARFGGHMFASFAPPPAFLVVTDKAVPDTVSIQEHVSAPPLRSTWHASYRPIFAKGSRAPKPW